MTQSHDVIVVGAGLAGLAAAQTLQKQGIDVLVLEARSEAGGRTRSSHALGSPVDLGASWLHGIKDHPLYDQALEQSLPMVETDYDSVRFYDSHGNPDRTSMATLDKLENALYKLGLGAKRKQSIRDRLSRLPTKLLARIPKATQELVIATALEEEYAADISELAASALEEGRDMRGADAILRGSYTSLIQPMAKAVNLRLEQVVCAVDYSGDGVTVTTRSGVFEADSVIVTVPLGVLKKGSIAFTPTLSAEKNAAINDLGMGLCNKFYLKFPQAFWNTEVDVVAYPHVQRGRWLSWYNYTAVTDEPILLGFCVADAAIEVEQFSDQEAIADAMTVLRTIYGADIPEPTEYVITRWGNDPFSCG
ncbi:MAG: monoamine oxidase, partial [Halieaceae bacterium]